MKFKPYPKYMVSGVEWLGDVPENWKVSRLKWSIKQSKGGVWGGEPVGDENDLVCIRVADFNRNQLKVDTNNLTTRQISISEQNGRRLEPGDLLLEKSGGGENQPVGCVIQYDQTFPAVCSNFIARLTPSESGFSDYFKFVHTSLYSLRLTTRSINQTSGIQNLDTDRYLSELVGYPPVEEQSTIATFLGRETAKIDTLIAKQEKLIDLLKEKRQAVISHVVTKGLDPTVSMKPSGVEWLGDVPDHWKLTRLGWITTEINDINHEMPSAVDSGVLFLSAKDLLDSGTLNFTEDVKQISEEDFQKLSRKILPQKNDIIYSRIGARLGKARLVETNHKFLVSYSCCVIRVISDLGLPAYICKLLDTDLVLTEAKARTNGIGVPDLGLDEIARFPIPLPPIDEQTAINKFLEQQTAKFSLLIAKAQQAIALQKEHRTALISAAVTGKIDVRDDVQEAKKAA